MQVRAQICEQTESWAQRWSHDLGADPFFTELRARCYAKSPLWRTQSVDFLRLDEHESGVKFTCLTPPATYFSPSIPDSQNWSVKNWFELFKSIKGEKGWDLCRLMMIPHAAAEKISEGARKAGLHTSTYKDSIHVLPGDLSFEKYLSLRSTSFNRNQRRCSRHAETAGFKFITDIKFEDMWDVYQRRHLSMEKSEADQDYAIKNSFEVFLKDLRNHKKEKNQWLEAGVVDEKGTLFAFAIGFWGDNGVFYQFQTAHDPLKHKQLRLGALVFEKLIQNALEKGFVYLSFLSDSHYISQFTPFRLNFLRVDVYSRTWTGMWLAFRRLACKTVKKFKSKKMVSTHEAVA